MTSSPMDINRSALRLLHTTVLMVLVLALLGGGLLGVRAHRQPMPGCNTTSAYWHGMQGLGRSHLLHHACGIHTANRPANRDLIVTLMSDTAVPPDTNDDATNKSHRDWALPSTDATRGTTNVRAMTGAATPTASAIEPAQPPLCPSRAAGADPEDARREPQPDQFLAAFEGCPVVMPDLWRPALNTEPTSPVDMPALSSKLARHQPLLAPSSATPHRAGRDTCLAPWWWMPAALVDATAILPPSRALPAAARAGTTKLWSCATVIAARQPHKPAAGAAGNTDALARAAAVKAAVNKAAAVWRATPANVDTRPHCRKLPAGLIDITCGTATAWRAMSMGAKGAVLAAVAGSWGLRPAAATLLHPEASAPLLLPWQSPLLAHVCASGCGHVRQSIGTVSQADARCSSAAIAGGRQLLCGSSNSCSTGLRLQPMHLKGAAASCACVTSATVAPVRMGQQANLAARPAALDRSVVSVGGGVESMHRVTAHGCGRNRQPGVGRPVCAGSCCRVDTAAAPGQAAAHALRHRQSVLSSCGVVLVLKASPAVWRWFSVGGGLLASLIVRAAACSLCQALASPAAAKALSAALFDAAIACVVPQPAHRMRLVGLRPSVLHGSSSVGSVVAARHCSWLPSGLAPSCCHCAAPAGLLTCRRHLWWHPVNRQVHWSA